MNTPSHVILNLAILRRGRKDGWIFAGALVPDLPIALMFIVERFIRGMPTRVIFDHLYFHYPWSTIVDLFNSTPLILLGLAAAMFFDKYGWQMFFSSMMIHVVLDLPVHTIDAHRHLWPLSDYKFLSLMNYWDRDHYAMYVALAEIFLVMMASWWLWPGVKKIWAKLALVGVNVIYVAGYVMFYYAN